MFYVIPPIFPRRKKEGLVKLKRLKGKNLQEAETERDQEHPGWYVGEAEPAEIPAFEIDNEPDNYEHGVMIR